MTIEKQKFLDMKLDLEYFFSWIMFIKMKDINYV